MSLFGSKHGDSLFPPTSSTTSQPTQTSSLFGNIQLPQASSGGGGLFGGPTTSPVPQQSSLFGNVGSSQPPSTGSGNLFASATASQPPQQTSLFGNLGGEGKPTSTTTGGGLFGAAPSAPSQAPPTSNLFGISAASQPSTASVFAPQQQQQNQQSQAGFGQTQQSNVQQISLAKTSSQPVYFDKLLDKGKKRGRDADGGPGFQELPSLQLGLHDIAKKVREIGGARTNAQAGRGADSSAHYLLAASGVNVGATRRDLNSLADQTATTSRPQQPTDWDPDTQKYMNQQQQKSTLRMISEGLERAQRNFDAYLEEHVDINWELQRKKIYEHFGLMPKNGQAPGELANSGNKGAFGNSTRRGRLGKTGRPGQSTLDRSIFGQSGLQKSVIGTPGVGSGNAALFTDVAEKSGTTSAAQDDRYLREKQRKYAEKVQILNQTRLRRYRDRTAESSYPVLQEFSGIEAQPGGDAPKQIADSYQALIEIIGDNKAKERQFADDYLDESPNSAKSIKIRKKIINGSRRSLEKAFYENLEGFVARNPKEASLGGVPTAMNKVRAYIRIRAARRDLVPDGVELSGVNEDYCWALMFFLLRSGLVKEAADYVTDNAAAFRTLDRNIITFITSYASSPDNRLDRKIQPQCNNVYATITKTAPGDQIDPYRIACYKIIGRCELSKRIIDSISQGVEDWIWLQFALAREVNRVDENAGDVFGLEEVRETIREIGQRHFAKGAEGLGGYGTFFYLQILGGMFEHAVSYLYSYSYVTAVHFAIALDYFGLLRVSDFSVSDSELLTHNTKEMPQISLGRMIGYYTRDFRAGNVEAAVDYLALICLNSDLPGALGKSQASLCHEALRELVLETREFARLLGDIKSNGTRLKGAIEERLELIGLADQEDFLKTVTVQAASVAEDNGRITDAVLLYHLTEDYETVISIINRALSEAIAVDIGQEQLRLQPLKPRAVAQQEQNQQLQQPDGSSLSLTSVDDPVVLAQNMITLYNNNNMYLMKIKRLSREACGVLLRLSTVKSKVAAGMWSEALDIIRSLDLLPLNARASIPAIRASAQAFNALPPTISRNIGPLLMWTITCIGRQRESLASRQYGGGEGTNRELSEELLGNARDLMVFAGLIKYRLGERVWEAVSSVGQNVGVY